ncbi:MAG: hypothetical protein FJ358_05025 [Thaumarchaeota archaeon]|nr:hypothetical protein [Nitrososphaerota archaeon]
MSTTNYAMVVIAVSVIAIGGIYVLTEPQPLSQVAKPVATEPSKQPAPSTQPSKPAAAPSAPKTVKVDIPIDAYMAPQGWKGEKVFTDKYYSPNKIEIRVGDTVEWINKDTITHTVTFYKGMTVDSGPYEQGKTWSYKFTKAGEFEYFCTLHPYMAGKVEVEA